MSKRSRANGEKEATAKGQNMPKGTRLPEDFKLPQSWKTWALTLIDKRLSLDLFTAGDWVDEIGENFADYWISKSSAATKISWRRTWQVWCRREVQTNGWRIEKRTAEKAPATFTPKDTSAWTADEDITTQAMRLGLWKAGMEAHELREAVRVATAGTRH